MFDKNISAGIDIYRRDYNNDYYDQGLATYESSTTGLQMRAGVPLTEYMSLIGRYTFNNEDVTIDEDQFFADFDGDGIRECEPLLAGRYLCDAIGNHVASILGVSLVHQSLDNGARPTRGLRASLSADFAGLGGNTHYARLTAQAARFWPLGGGFIFSLSGEGGIIKGLKDRGLGEDDVLLTDRFFLGEPQIRGFDIRGVGPRVVRRFYGPNPEIGEDGKPIPLPLDDDSTVNDALGGTKYYLAQGRARNPAGLGCARDGHPALGVRRHGIGVGDQDPRADYEPVSRRHFPPATRHRRQPALHAGQCRHGGQRRVHAGNGNRRRHHRYQRYQSQSAVVPHERGQHAARQFAAAVRRAVLRQHLEAAPVDRFRGQLEFAVRAVPHRCRLSDPQARGRRHQDLLLQRRDPVLMKLQLSIAALALSAALATPAAAQVSGVALANPTVAIARTRALTAGYTQINTTFQAQLTQLQQQEQQRITVLQQLDTDKDGQLGQAEQTAAQANTTVVQQLQTIEQQIAQTQQPITQARVYVIEQLLLQYSAAMQQVVTDKKVQLILDPGSALYAAPGVDVTDAITAALNQRVPTVSTAVPAGWQPQRQSIQTYQDIQQLLAAAAQAQQAQQAQQPAAATPQQPVQGR